MVDGLCVCVSAYHWLTNNSLRKRRTRREEGKEKERCKHTIKIFFAVCSPNLIVSLGILFFFAPPFPLLVHSYTMNVLPCLLVIFFSLSLFRFSHAYDSDWWSLRLLLLHRLLKLYQSTDYDYDLIDIDFDWCFFCFFFGVVVSSRLFLIIIIQIVNRYDRNRNTKVSFNFRLNSYEKKKKSLQAKEHKKKADRFLPYLIIII